MFGSLISRFRGPVLLLAFMLGMAGQVASTAAMAMQMQPATSAGMASEHPCPAWPGEQDSGLMANCSAIGCWTAPALPAQNAGAEPLRHTVYGIVPDLVLAGLATAPDPHPPRFLFHT